MEYVSLILAIAIVVESVIIYKLNNSNKQKESKNQELSNQVQKKAEEYTLKIEQIQTSGQDSIQKIKKEYDQKLKDEQNKYTDLVTGTNQNIAMIELRSKETIDQLLEEQRKRLEYEVSHCDLKVRETENKALAQIEAIKTECAKIIREKEKIAEANRFMLAEKDEKDLIIDIYLALSELTKSIERLEEPNVQIKTLEELGFVIDENKDEKDNK